MQPYFRIAPRLFKLIALSSVILAAGCATRQAIPLDYSASPGKSAQGFVDVGEFHYAVLDPRISKPVAQNQIRNTAVLGGILINRPVPEFLHDAVLSEVRSAGIQSSSDKKILTADVEDFAIDDLGFRIDWTLKIKYDVIDNSTHQTIYESTKNVQRRTDKFADALGDLKETVRLNIEQLMDDPNFITAIR